MNAIKLPTADKAREMWNAMNPNDRAGICFGMFPYTVMQAAADEGYDGRELALALMDVALNARLGGQRRTQK